MQKMITTAAAVIVLVGLTPAPVGAQRDQHQQMAAELRMLQEQSQQLALALTQLAEAIKAVNTRIDDSNKALQKSIADQKLVIDGFGDALSVIRERTGDTNVRIGSLREELEALRSSVAALASAQPAIPQTSELTDPNAPVPTGTTPSAPALPPPTPSPSTVGLSPERAFQSAFADYGAGQYTLAILSFESFIKNFPRSENAETAQFYIGESYFLQGKFAEAITAYNAVIQNYPRGNQLAQAYYKRGFAQQNLGQLDAARESFETVLKSYKDTPVATLAKQRIDSLSPPSPAASRP